MNHSITEGRKRNKVTINLTDGEFESFSRAAQNVSLHTGNFMGMMARIGFRQVMENPELLVKVMVK